MAKVLIKRISVDIALHSHKCRYNKQHIIAQGDKRLKVIEGRKQSHYCIDCAKKFVCADIERLQNILSQL